MLLRNLCVSDGLVNIAMGVITAILSDGNESVMPRCVCVRFTNKNVGRQAKLNTRTTDIPNDSVCILPFEEQFNSGQIKRRQFPLKLAFASTIHKVQGMSMDKIVLSMDGMFAAGMAYVGLSRVTDIKGLFITHLNEKKHGIRCNEQINVFLQEMSLLDLTPFKPISLVTSSSVLTIVHHNVEGLQNRLTAINSHTEIINASIFLATETWLKPPYDTDRVSLPDFSTLHKLRSECSYYTDPDVVKGGVSCYIKDDIPHMFLSVENCTETIAILLPVLDCILIGSYRPPSFPIDLYVQFFERFFETHEVCKATNILIFGDFNENLLLNQNNKFFNFLINKNFTQLITQFTTTGATLLDAIYFRGSLDIQSGVLQSFYSYHEPTYAICKCK